MNARLHAQFDAPIVMIGFGSIGRGTLPLILRHIALDRAKMTVIEPSAEFAFVLAEYGIAHLQLALTPENIEQTLFSLFPNGRGLLVNLSVDVGSIDLMVLCQRLGVMYLDTVIEPWPGFYFGSPLSNADRTNYPLREKVRAMGQSYVGGPTAISCCGANPGMVSWLLKEAMLRLARDLGMAAPTPTTREAWASFMQSLDIKGIHVAERDTQISAAARRNGVFVNTWSVDGLLSEGFQPAELGWGTHERHLPANGHRFDHGAGYAIWIDRAGADTRVRSWCPDVGPQFGLVVTHNEALSISDYYTVWQGERAVFRPTCHYAYHPCPDAILSLHEMIGAGKLPREKHILTPQEIVSGGDDLGVLIYGHAKGAMWYGSRLSNAQARELAPYQNATAMQVTSAVLAALVWAIENPRAGFVEADEMDHVRCLEVQRPYLGEIEAHYTDWTPLSNRINHFAENSDRADPWQFVNFLAV